MHKSLTCPFSTWTPRILKQSFTKHENIIYFCSPSEDYLFVNTIHFKWFMLVHKMSCDILTRKAITTALSMVNICIELQHNENMTALTSTNLFTILLWFLRFWWSLTKIFFLFLPTNYLAFSRCLRQQQRFGIWKREMYFWKYWFRSFLFG